MKISRSSINNMVKEHMESLFNDSKTVEFLDNILDEEISNAETISVVIDRLEYLEEENDKKEARIQELERVVNVLRNNSNPQGSN